MYWLVGLVSYTLTPLTITKSVMEGSKIKKNEQIVPIKCELCKEKYRRIDINKTLPLKMIINIRNHLERRGIIDLFPYTKCNFKTLLMSDCRICSLCYSLAIHEQKLIETESKMAHAQSIPSIAVDHSEQQNLVPNRLYQWRSMIYIKKLSVLCIIILEI